MRVIICLMLAANAWAAGAQRIVSTTPSVTETLFAMGLGPKVVGDSIYCNYPPEAAKLPRIGSLLKPDVEAILALRPDLVVMEKIPNHLAEELTRLHVPFVVMESRNLDTIYTGAREIGKAAGASDAAERLIQSMQSQLAGIRKLTEGKARPSVAFIVGHNDGRLEGMVAGSGTSYFSDLLDYGGGRNVFADITVAYPKISLEEILSRNPDVIMELSGDTRPKQDAVLALWKPEAMLKAVKAGRVYALESGPFVIPGPRAVEAARLVLHFLHPEIKQ